MDQDTLKKFVHYLEQLKKEYLNERSVSDTLKEQNHKLLKDYEDAINIINNFTKEKDDMLSKIKEIEKFKSEFVNLYKSKLENNNQANEGLINENNMLKEENEKLKNSSEDEKIQIIDKLNEENEVLKNYVEELESKINNNQDQNLEEDQETNEEFEKVVNEIENYKKEVEILTQENNELTQKIGIDFNNEE